SDAAWAARLSDGGHRRRPQRRPRPDCTAFHHRRAPRRRDRRQARCGDRRRSVDGRREGRLTTFPCAARICATFTKEVAMRFRSLLWMALLAIAIHTAAQEAG